MNHKLTILVRPINGVGHVNACAGALRCLPPRGHRVIFVVDNSFKGRLAAQGYEEHIYQLPKTPDIQIAGEATAKILVESGIVGDFTPFEKMENLAKFTHSQKTYDECAFVNKIVQNAIDQYKPDVIYIDSPILLPSIYNSGIPWMVNNSSQQLFHLRDDRVPPGGFGLPTVGNLEKYKKHRDLSDQFFYEKKFNDFLESIGYSRYPKDILIPEGALLTIYAYPEELNYPEAREQKNCFNMEVFNRNELPRELVELEKLVPVEFLSNSLDGRYSGKLIYVSMGSMGAVDLGLMRRLVAVLGKTNHKYIVSKGPRHSEYELPTNMFGGGYLPQMSIIPHVDLVITHGGCNTVTEVFAEGKPMIILPLFGDQFDNAQRLEETGYGLRLDTYKFTDEQMISGIDELLNDQQLIQKLKKASNRISLLNRHQELADKIEQLLIKK